MPRSDDGFIMVVRLWVHDGVPVARLLAHPPAKPSTEDGTTVAGSDRIIAAMARWVTDLAPGPHGGDST